MSYLSGIVLCCPPPYTRALPALLRHHALPCLIFFGITSCHPRTRELLFKVVCPSKWTQAPSLLELSMRNSAEVSSSLMLKANGVSAWEFPNEACQGSVLCSSLNPVRRDRIPETALPLPSLKQQVGWELSLYESPGLVQFNQHTPVSGNLIVPPQAPLRLGYTLITDASYLQWDMPRMQNSTLLIRRQYPSPP